MAYEISHDLACLYISSIHIHYSCFPYNVQSHWHLKSFLKIFLTLGQNFCPRHRLLVSILCSRVTCRDVLAISTWHRFTDLFRKA